MCFKNFKKVTFVLILISGWSLSLFASEQNEQFTIGDLTIAPGEMKSGSLSVAEKDGIGTFIPITVINGSMKGKVLALVAGVHGYEYPPILALYRLKKMIDAQSLSGTLILVHIAHILSFQKRTIYYNPFDWENLNRVFPGEPQGTISQRIAYVLNEEVVKRCDYLIDLHCGDGNEALIPYCYWMISGNEEIDKMSKDMVLAFGIKHIIIDKSRPKDTAHSKYLGNTAILYEKPAITFGEDGILGKEGRKSGLYNRLFWPSQPEPSCSLQRNHPLHHQYSPDKQGRASL